MLALQMCVLHQLNLCSVFHEVFKKMLRCSFFGAGGLPTLKFQIEVLTKESEVQRFSNIIEGLVAVFSGLAFVFVF